MDIILEKIKEFADKAHGDQKRKYTPERYIVHPVRVMKLCQEYTSSIPILAAALLHDVLEDTNVTRNDLHDFPINLMVRKDAERTIYLVIELTDTYTKSNFPGWNRRKRKHKEALRIEQTSAEAQTIKYADIIDNCNEIAVQDPEFAPVFLRECKMLLEKMPKGNELMYKKAMESVIRNLKQVLHNNASKK